MLIKRFILPLVLGAVISASAFDQGAQVKQAVQGMNKDNYKLNCGYIQGSQNLKVTQNSSHDPLLQQTVLYSAKRKQILDAMNQCSIASYNETDPSLKEHYRKLMKYYDTAAEECFETDVMQNNSHVAVVEQCDKIKEDGPSANAYISPQKCDAARKGLMAAKAMCDSAHRNMGMKTCGVVGRGIPQCAN